MKKLFKNEKFTRVLYILLSFVLSALLTAVSLLTVIKVTVFSGSFLSDTLNTSSYYTDLCSEITDDMVNIGNASGLHKSFFDRFIDEVMVREDVQSYIDSFYKGEELKVNTDNFQRKLRDALSEYEKKKNIDPKNVSSESIDFFVKEASKIYTGHIEVTYFDMIQKDFLEWSSSLLIYDIVAIVSAVGIIVFVILTNKWKHLAVKYIYFATLSSGLFVLTIPAALMASGIAGKVVILTRSLNDLFTTAVNGLLMNMFIFAGIMLALSVILFVVHHNLRKKATA